MVDEIGKMELFSKTFVSSLKRLFDSKSAIILATVPVSKGKLIPIVEDLKKRPDCQLITVCYRCFQLMSFPNLKWHGYEKS